ncbi:Ig-like domain-containing protein [Patescibacteria group bacterium]|nr:Ig-like domain-containing protein [Patescibacteria group bacterium]
MPNQDLNKFIKEALASGKTLENIKTELTGTGWDEKEISAATKEFINPAGDFFHKNKKLLIFFGIIAVLIAAGILGWYLYPNFQKPAQAKFSLEAVNGDQVGIEPQTTFLLKSSENISESDVKKIVKFDPEIAFSVKKIKSVLGAITETIQAKAVYEIKPQDSLAQRQVYQVKINDSDFAEHEYGWAFQTKAVFQVTQTHPRDKATSVPLNSGIEIIFNRDNPIGPENNFEISPKVDGTFEINRNNTLVFLPKNLTAGTVYTITIKKGLRAQNTDDTLVEDFSFAFETGSGNYGEYSYFSFSENLIDSLPEIKPSLQIYSYNINLENLKANVYRFPGADAFLKSYVDSRNWNWYWTNYYWKAGKNDIPSNTQKVVSFRPEISTVQYNNFFEIPQVLDAGFYLVDVEYSGGRHEQAWLQINPLSRYFSVSPDKSFVWIQDFNKKEPQKDVKISYVGGGEEKNLGVTNQDGLLEFATPDSLKNQDIKDFKPKFFKAQKSGLPEFLIAITDRWGYRSSVSQGNLYWNYISTDRAVYQISDSIKYWGVAKGRQSDIKEKMVNVGLYSYGYYFYGYDSSQDIPVVSQDVLVSQFDTVEGELNFKGLSPGYYVLQVKNGKNIISSVSVEIMTYTKPAYEIKITPSKEAAYAGENIIFRVAANFFDGTPVSKLRLKYSGYWDSSFSGELILNGNGEGEVTYTPQYIETDSFYYPRSLELTFQPVLSEEGEIWGSASVLVFGPNIYLQAFQENQSGDNYKITAKTNRIDIIKGSISENNYQPEYIGEPASNFTLSAELIKTVYVSRETGQYYDPINKVVRKIYDYSSYDQSIEQFSGQTNSSGEWIFTKTVPQEQNASYRMIFSGHDNQGRRVKQTVYFYRPYYNESSDFSISLKGNKADNEEYSIGEKINLETKIERGDKPANPKILYYRFKNSIEEVFVSGNYQIQEEFGTDFVPSEQYMAVMLGPSGFVETNSVMIPFKKSDRKLNIQINPDKESYRPGDQIKISLTIKDKDGKPVSAQVNVAAVDEALFHILSYNWRQDILIGLYQRIYNMPLSNGSQYNLLKTEGAESGGCFAAGTQVLMADKSSKPIEEIKIGDKITTFTSEKDHNLKSAIVQGISVHKVEGYLIINGRLKVTPEHKIFLNGAWNYAGVAKAGDELITSKGQKEKINFLVFEKKQTFVYNIVVDSHHTYFADGLYVHNAEKGGARTNFVDLALFQTLKADGGQAQISFKAPDNITSWRTTVLAYDSDGMKAGQSEKLIKVSLPYFVDAVLGSYYLEGDNPYLRLRSFGTDYNFSEPVDYSITCEALSFNQSQISKDNSVYIPLGKLKEGEYDFTISGKQNKLQDSLVRSIKVLKTFFQQPQTAVYPLSEDLSNLEGNSDGFTKLVFMDQGKGKFYKSLRENSYGDGIRSDQSTAAFFSQKILADYFDQKPPENNLDLSGYQVPDGGLALFPYGDSDLELSAKLADLAPDYVFQDQLAKYFYASLNDKKTDIHRIAKALYGLAGLREPVLNKIYSVKDSSDLNFEDKIYVALALARLGDKENARQIYEAQIRPQVRFQGSEAWLAEETDQTKQVKLTSAIAVLAAHLDSGDTDPLWNYISKHYPIRDLNIIEQIIVAQNELPKFQKQQAEFSYEAGNKKGQVKLQNGKTFTLNLSKEELNSIKFSGIEGDISAASFYEKYTNSDELTKNRELSLDRQYLVNSVTTNSFPEGSIVLVRLTPKFAATAMDGPYQIIDYLPVGLRPITQLYKAGLGYGWDLCDTTWYPTKIVNNAVYFNISKDFNGKCSQRTLNYYARVVSKGDFQANPAIIQSLKDLESLNVSAKDDVSIK